MNILTAAGEIKTRQTTAEEIYANLKADIISLQFAPGAKLSEAEIAKYYKVSRQPVREAFMRLGDLNLLQIRPQRATLVRKISTQHLEDTRFLRAAIEVEVIRDACKHATKEGFQKIEQNLALQKAAVDATDGSAIRALDYEFHRLICQAANRSRAFGAIAENKAHTDRVCTLELASTAGLSEILEGHQNILIALKARDEIQAVENTRIHLTHLDATIENARQSHPEYFEP